MDYKYYKENVLMCGEMNSGKTYMTQILLSGIPKEKIIIMADEAEYDGFDDVFLRICPVKPYTVKWIDDLINTCYSEQLYRKVVVFDDIDRYIKRDRESEELANWFVDSSHIGMSLGLTKEEAGSGSIILCKRPVNLDKRILQGCRWIFLFKGCLFDDVKRVQETCMLPESMLGDIDHKDDKNTYYYVDRQPPEVHACLLVDRATKKVKYITGASL